MRQILCDIIELDKTTAILERELELLSMIIGIVENTISAYNSILDDTRTAIQIARKLIVTNTRKNKKATLIINKPDNEAAMAGKLITIPIHDTVDGYADFPINPFLYMDSNVHLQLYKDTEKVSKHGNQPAPLLYLKLTLEIESVTLTIWCQSKLNRRE